MQQAKTLGVILTVLGGAVGLWVFTRFTSLAGKLHTWQPPFSDYETATLFGAVASVALIIFGVVNLIKPANPGTPLHPEQSGSACPGCSAPVEPEARVCPFCATELPIVSPAERAKADLLRAALAGNVESVIDSLEQGADIDAKNQHGATALFLAAIHDRAELAEVLLKRGADPHIRNVSGKTPLEAAREKGHTQVVAVLS